MNDPAQNPFGSTAVALRQNSGVQTTGVETAATALAAQATAMVNARYGMAMKNPRNWDQVRQDILKECRRPSFANNKSALYRKPIGAGVEGLGIRFTEMAMRCMTNVLIETNSIFEDDLKEVHRVTDTDLESNVTYPLDIRVSKTVERSKPAEDGSYISMRKNSYGKAVYTVPANDDDLLNKRGALVSKAQRTLALRLLPGDIQDEAEEIIRQIRMDEAAKDPDAERKKIADAFAGLNVKAVDLEGYLGHALDGCTPAELVDLRGLYGALKDGEATWQTVMENKRSLEAQSAGDPAAQALKAKTGASALKEAIKPSDSGASDGGKKPADSQKGAAGPVAAAPAMTVIDAIAKLSTFSDVEVMALWADAEVSDAIRQDERFTKKFRERMDALKETAGKGKK